MKPIYALNVTLAAVTLFGLIWYLQIGSAGDWNSALQRERDGHVYEATPTNDGTMPVNNTPLTNITKTSTSSWANRLQNLIPRRVRAIKRVGHRSRVAPPGVFFTLRYVSVRNPSGITGIEAGTRVVCVKDWGPTLLVTAGDLEFEAQREYLTNDLDVADLAVRGDGQAQQAVQSYIAQQQQALDQRSDKWKMQASRQQ